MKSLCLLSLCVICIQPLRAEVVTDGSLGQTRSLSGPDYQIGADLGQQVGGNLFHSFQDFNLHSQESATFSGPANVQNIISRVTGGNPSNIDGLIRSTIPNADLYFLNPYGILFGPNAKLDVQGGFHASTADYLRLQDGGRFDARVPSNSLLTMAPPSAFGFLTDTPATITTQDSALMVLPEKTLSLIGGDLQLQVTSLASPVPQLNAEAGRLNLASLASSGEVIPTPSGLTLSAVAQRGTITGRNTWLTVSGQGGGSIFLRGGRLELTNSRFGSQTYGNQKGGIIDLQVEDLQLINSLISATTTGLGRGSDIFIKVANQLIADGDFRGVSSGGIFGETYGDSTSSGDAGDIYIEAREISLSDGAQLSGSTYGTGRGGILDLNVADALTVSDVSPLGFSTGIHSNSNSEKANGGNAGKISIAARSLQLNNGGQIGSATFGGGAGGTIYLQITDRLTATGGTKQIGFSGVFVNSENTQANGGNGGTIEIKAGQIFLRDHAQLSSATFGSGQGGHLTVKAEELNFSGFSSGTMASTAGSGNAGNVDITARQVTISDGAGIDSVTLSSGQGGNITLKGVDTLIITGNQSGILANSVSNETPAGQAGKITIAGRQITLIDGATISSGSGGVGRGGNILIQATGSVTLAGNSQVMANSYGKNTNAGDAGHIKIETDQIELNTGGQIASVTAGPGQGGTVQLNADKLTILGGAETKRQSGIFTNSQGEMNQAGNAGHIEITAREVNLKNGALLVSATLGAGQGGTILLKVADRLTVAGGNPRGISTIAGNSISTSPNAGNAGRIEIHARQLALTNGGQIANVTSGPGQGGTIFLHLSDNLTIAGVYEEDSRSGIFGNSQGQESNAGNAGRIEVTARQITLTAGAVITNSTFGSGQGGAIHLQVTEALNLSNGDIAASSYSTELNAGNAGAVVIQASKINLNGKSSIATQTANANGGDILLTVPDQLYLQGPAQITTSVAGGQGNGGNITLSDPQFVVLNRGQIKAQADEGHGGNIGIVADQFIATPDSLVSASSKLGIDGRVEIDSPESDISGMLIVLSGSFMNVANQFVRCSSLYEEESSRFSVIHLRGRPPEPGDWQ